MSLHHAAQHLASKGRNGDTTLVHMTKGEVAGLQALAKRHGTTLTKNPDTGLPEAFGLKQLLPMAGGAALMMIPGMQPMGAAAIMGGLQFARTGSLTQGLMAGMGAYGGAGLAGGVTAAGTQAYAGEAGANALGTTPELMATETGANQALTTSYPDMSGNITPETSYIDPVKGQQYSTAYSDALTNAQTAPRTDMLSKGFSSLGTETGRNAAITGMGGGMGAAGYGLAAASPLMVNDPDKYVPPEIKSDTDMGQRYAYDSGYSNDIPGRTGPAAYKAISDEEAKKLYGFAEGGEVGYPGEPVVRMAEGGEAAAQSDFTGYSPVDAYVAARGLGTGIDYTGYDTPVNQGISAIAPQAASGANPNQNIVDLYAKADARRAAEEAEAAKQAKLYNGMTIMDSSKYGGLSPVMGMMTGATMVGYDVNGQPVYAGGYMDPYSYQPDANGVYGPNTVQYKMQTGTLYAEGGSVDCYADGGGISTLGGYSDGGRLLKGPGDGMSDNIPAKIGAKQPARLADGEFVVPADVVSHLGNGSTDAGAKQLYKMMDKIRTARTGKKAQGKQINPNKFTPA